VVRDHQLEDGVPEKFEPLVVEVKGFALEREAGMGERFSKEQ